MYKKVYGARKKQTITKNEPKEPYSGKAQGQNNFME